MLWHFEQGQIRCQDVQRFLYEYTERELDARVLFAFDQHLLSCPACRQTTASYHKTRDTVRRHITREVRIPHDLRQKLLASLRPAGP